MTLQKMLDLRAELGGLADNEEMQRFLQQAESMWKTLDELAENDPKAYKSFIKKQLEEGKEHARRTVLPQPYFAVATTIESISKSHFEETKRTPGKIFSSDSVEQIHNILSQRGHIHFVVNICGSMKVKSPQSENGSGSTGESALPTGNEGALPIKILTCGLRPFRRREMDHDGLCVDAILHPSVVAFAQQNVDRTQGLIRLAFQCVEKDYAWSVANDFENEDSLYVAGKGPVGASGCVTHFLDIEKHVQSLSLVVGKEDLRKYSPHLVPKQGLGSLDMASPEYLLGKLKKTSTVELTAKDIRPARRGSIEPRSRSVDGPTEKTKQQGDNMVEMPEFSFEESLTGQVQQLIISLTVPKLKEITHADLEVSERRLCFELPGIYKLDVALPCKVCPDSVSARLSRRKGILRVKCLCKDDR